MELINGMTFMRNVLAILVCSEFVGAFQCNEGLSRWFLAYGEHADDEVAFPNNQVYQICHPFNAYGVHYKDGLRIKVKGGTGAGTVHVFPRSGIHSEGAFEIRASRGNYEPTSIGLANLRVTESPNNLDKISKIINDGYPCLERGPFRPVVAFVATFSCMKQKNIDGARDTFQLVVAINAEKTYVILNYHKLNKAKGLQFAIINAKTRSKFIFGNVKRDLMTTELVESTNGARKGVWVYDVTESTPRRPEHCPKEPNECTMTNFGSIHTFDGALTVAPHNTISTLSQYLENPTSDCNFILKVIMEVHGDVKYIDFYVGSYDEKDIETSMIRFEFDKQAGLVRQLDGLTKPNIIDLQQVGDNFVWPPENSGNESVTITKTTLGWTLENDFCGYHMEFRPEGHEPEVRLRVSEDYKDRLDGHCENYDGDDKDDYLDGYQ